MSRETSSDADVVQAEWWKAVLAEYPTGVSLVTATDGNGGPVGMIIGSFTAISQDPPLIGFFADDVSSTCDAIVAAERFAVSVLGERQDDLLRSFIRKDENRFTQPGVITSPHAVPRLTNAVAWFEARVVGVDRYGDHRLVVGHVEEFGVGAAEAGLPLLYRRGGFGTFAVPSDAVDARLIGDRLLAARATSEVLAAVADEIGRDIAIATMVGESVVVLAIVQSAAGSTTLASLDALEERRIRSVGLSLPFAAPVEPLFAAWAADRVKSLWIERARHLVGSVDRGSLEAQLHAIRERGYALSVDRDLTERFFVLATDPHVAQETYPQLWSEYATRMIESTDPDVPLADVAAVQVPIRDEHGDVILVMTVSDLAPFPARHELDAFARRLIDAADAATRAIARAAGPA